MEAHGLLGNAFRPNVYRIQKEGPAENAYPRELPGVLRGIMTEEEYANYIERIETASRVLFVITLVSWLMIFSWSPSQCS